MRGIAIEVKNLYKKYNIYKSPRDMLFSLMFGKKVPEKWALKDITFSVNKGDVVGILGRNGAGKSTLLKILSGIVKPTSGEVFVDGRISSILELGTGFHPDYTGRENIIMGGMCLGMTRAEVISKMESIIEFSELRSYIDQPFKTYSSGMQSRLTFSTAICINPDILIIDEALAAGDGFFINKCLSRIKEICHSGATVLFVSHSTELVRRLCNKAILINDGAIEKTGDSSSITTFYDSLVLVAASSANQIAFENSGQKIQTDIMNIKEVSVYNKEGEKCNAFFQNSFLLIEIEFYSTVHYEDPFLWIKFMRSDGVLATSWHSAEPVKVNTGVIKPGLNFACFQIEKILLGDGEYSLGLGIFPNKTGSDSFFYNDPFCMWDGVSKITIKRKSRPLSTIFDQHMSAYIKKDDQCAESLG